MGIGNIDSSLSDMFNIMHVLMDETSVSIFEMSTQFQLWLDI